MNNWCRCANALGHAALYNELILMRAFLRKVGSVAWFRVIEWLIAVLPFLNLNDIYNAYFENMFFLSKVVNKK